jgi:hypothetical protein
MPAIAGPFCALAGLPVSRADLFAHVIIPSLPIRHTACRPATCARPPLHALLPAPAPVLAHTELPAFPPLPHVTCAFCFLRRTAHPARVALAHFPHLHIYCCHCAFLLYTHTSPPFTFVHPRCIVFLRINSFWFVFWPTDEIKSQYVCKRRSIFYYLVGYRSLGDVIANSCRELTLGPAGRSALHGRLMSNSARTRAKENPWIALRASIGCIFMNWKQLHPKLKPLRAYGLWSSLYDMLLRFTTFNYPTFLAYSVNYHPRRLNTLALSIISGSYNLIIHSRHY